MICCGKSLVGLLCAVGVAAGVAIVVSADDAKPAQPSTPAPQQPGAKDEPKPADGAATYVLGFKVNRIDGTEEDLSIYKGKVVLIVNVASKCGFTPQYTGLQKLYTDKKDAGLVILGFPSNDFRSQEPGTNKEIAEFCESNFKVTFPMFEKISVKGPTAHPLYKKIASVPSPVGGEPKWNFTKYLVDRSGNLVARYDSAIRPDDKNLLAKVDELLKAK